MESDRPTANGSTTRYNYREENSKPRVEREEGGYVRCADCKLFFTRLGLPRHSEKCRNKQAWNPLNLSKLIHP